MDHRPPCRRRGHALSPKHACTPARTKELYEILAGFEESEGVDTFVCDGHVLEGLG